MRSLAPCVLALLAVVGCAAEPREKPLLEAPALTSDAASSGIPSEIVGAWGSESLKGPGSAAYRRIDLIVREDGRCLMVGKTKQGGTFVQNLRASADGFLTRLRPDGTTVRFGWHKEQSILVLTDRGSELRLAPIRP